MQRIQIVNTEDLEAIRVELWNEREPRIIKHIQMQEWAYLENGIPTNCRVVRYLVISEPL